MTADALEDENDRDARWARLDREWERERAYYLVRGRRGKLYRPSARAGGLARGLGGGFGLLWTIFGAWAVAKVGPQALLLPMAGVVFTLVVLAYGAAMIVKASAYRRAEAAYLRRRQQFEE